MYCPHWFSLFAYRLGPAPLGCVPVATRDWLCCYVVCWVLLLLFFFFSSRRRHTRYWRDWSSDVCSSDLRPLAPATEAAFSAGHAHERRLCRWRERPRSHNHRSKLQESLHSVLQLQHRGATHPIDRIDRRRHWVERDASQDCSKPQPVGVSRWRSRAAIPDRIGVKPDQARSESGEHHGGNEWRGFELQRAGRGIEPPPVTWIADHFLLHLFQVHR